MQGKTFLTGLFAAVRCILYPGTKIVVSSGTLKQANEVLLKIQDEFMPNSIFLRSEIAKCNIGQNDAAIYFKNSSWIKTRTSTDKARSARANLIIIDEFRMVDKFILDTVLKKFLSAARHPKYLDKPEYAHLQEENKEIYMSSAYFKSSWAYQKAQDYVVQFFNDKAKYFICGIPYQVSIKENLLSRVQIQNEMNEISYNEMLQQMEMECIWYGDDDGSLFKYDDVQARRTYQNAFYPLRFYNDQNTIPKLEPFEKRILSVDVALMQSTKKKKNDASAFYINRAIKTGKTTYQSNFVYGETFEGLTTDQLGLIVMRYFYQYNCTDLVIDTNGVGQGVFDYIIRDHYDEETGETYRAMTCINNDDMALRCKDRNALKCVWSVKADQSFNNDICVLLRNGIKNGNINFLISEHECDSILKKAYKGYSSLTPTLQSKLKIAYAETTMMQYELAKLEHKENGGKIKVIEPYGMRKDRYSSVAYSYWCAKQLELKLKPKHIDTETLLDKLKIRKGKSYSFLDE